MEKKRGGLGFIIFLLVIAIAAIVGMGYYIYVTHINENQEIIELRAEIKELQEQNQQYQTALENINKTLGNINSNKN